MLYLNHTRWIVCLYQFTESFKYSLLNLLFSYWSNNRFNRAVVPSMFFKLLCCSQYSFLRWSEPFHLVNISPKHASSHYQSFPTLAIQINVSIIFILLSHFSSLVNLYHICYCLYFNQIGRSSQISLILDALSIFFETHTQFKHRFLASMFCRFYEIPLILS